MKTEKEILEDLLSEATEEKERAIQEANDAYNELVSLCILSSLSQLGKENILSAEEKYHWENRNNFIVDYERAVKEIEFWKQRKELLVKPGINPFREIYGVIRDQTGFVMGLRKNG